MKNNILGNLFVVFILAATIGVFIHWAIFTIGFVGGMSILLPRVHRMTDNEFNDFMTNKASYKEVIYNR